MSNFKTITDAVTLLKREDGTHLIPIRQYYIDRIAKLGAAYRVSIPEVNKGMGLCPLHDDLKPSLGILTGKDGRERFNCMGCQQFGHIVDLHRKMEQRYQKRSIGMQTAAYELLHIYNIDREWIDSLVGYGDDFIGKGDHQLTRLQKRKQKMDAIKNSFTDEDYRKSIVNGVIEGQSVAYFNTLLHMKTLAFNDEDM